MKAILIIAALLGTLICCNAQLPPSTLKPATPAPAPEPSSIPGIFAAEPAQAQGPSIAYRKLLTRLYTTLENPTKWPSESINRELTSIRQILANAPSTPERQSAINLCAWIERADLITAQFRKRLDFKPARVEIRSSGEERKRAEAELESRDAAFEANIERQWKEALAPVQAGAKAAWQAIPETATVSSPLIGNIERQRLEETSTWSIVTVERVLKDGALVVPMKRVAVASALGCVGFGGGVGTRLVPGDQIIFAKGLTGVAESQRHEVLCYKDGTHTYRDEFGEVRTIEKWSVVKTREQ